LGKLVTNFIKFIAQVVILCVSLLDDIKGMVALFSTTSVILLLECTNRAPLMVNMAECGMLL
jgi:hypothetical protein